MSGFNALNCRDLRDPPWIFYSRTHGDRLELRPAYQCLRCIQCKHFDVLSALQKGVSPEVRGPTVAVDAGFSRDHQLIVSIKCHKVLCGVAGDLLVTFDLPGDNRYKIIYPKRVILPPKKVPAGNVDEPWGKSGNPFEVFDGYCDVCGRPRAMSFCAQHYLVPGDVRLAGVAVETGFHATQMLWIADDDIVQAIEESGVTKGWWIRKHEFKNDETEKPKRRQSK